MSQSLWFLPSPRFLALLTVLSYAGAMTGCGASTATTDTAPIEEVEHDHDHADHDHDHADHDHDHADHDHSGDINVDELMPIQSTPAPESLDQGISQLTSLRDSIAKGFADDDVDAIHDELHSVGGLLEEVKKMIQSSEMSDPVKQQASGAIESLFEAFGDVDAKLHGGDGKEYSDVAEKINTAIETLTNLEVPN